MQLLLLHQSNSSFSNLVSFAALKSPKTTTSGLLGQLLYDYIGTTTTTTILLVMLGQRYTTPMVTVVCPVTSLHHMASLQSASSCNCTSYAGIFSLMYNYTPPLLLPIMSFLNIA